MSAMSRNQSNRKRKEVSSDIRKEVAKRAKRTGFNDFVLTSESDYETDIDSEFSFGRETGSNTEGETQSASDIDISDILEAEDLDFDVFAYIKTLDFKLRKWAVKNNIKLIALSELLKILKEEGHNSLPKDARTLLKTPKNVEVTKMGSGQCWYGGMKEKLSEVCRKKGSMNLLELNLHIDGTPIYKSSKAEFWPVQCDVKDFEMKPFFVQIFKGSSKPASAEIFMRPLLDEIHELLANGLSVTINGGRKLSRIRIDKFILDAPARAFLKCIIGHAGYFSCEKCEEPGEFINKVAINIKNKKSRNKAKNAGHVCLIGTNAPLRTDESFRNKENKEHHHGDSPLEELPIDIIKDIPLDYLHLILYGGMKRLLTLWIDGTSHFKLSERELTEISKKHERAGATKPAEINRTTRSLKCLSYWKATEFRTFLLKTGPVVLRGHLTEGMYNHFLALHCAVTICCTQSLLMYLPVAKQLYRTFTEKFADFYGADNSTYSIHSLIHVVDDVERYGVLDGYSAFPGESNLGFLKNLVRGGHLPLQQVVKRIAERDSCEKLCEFEDVANMNGKALQKGILRLKGIRLDSSEKNGWILTKGKIILRIRSITENDDSITIHGSALLKENQENFYESPIASIHLGIYQSKLDSTPMSIDLENMLCKLYRLEISSEKSVFFPLSHTIK